MNNYWTEATKVGLLDYPYIISVFKNKKRCNLTLTVKCYPYINLRDTDDSL